MNPTQLGENAPVPPAGGPYVPPPESGTPPNPVPAPVQAPVEAPPTQARVFTPPPPSAPVTPPVAAPASPEPAKPTASEPGTPGLLTDLESVKPSLETLKIPEGVDYPKEFLTGIVSSSETLTEAQKRFDTAHSLYTTMQKDLIAKNSEWITNLKQDPEVGKDKWEASLDLYRKGVVEEFGLEFANKLRKGLIDAEPNFFKAVVRRMRAKSPKPIVNGEPPASPNAEPKTTEEFAKKTYAGMGNNYQKVATPKGPSW